MISKKHSIAHFYFLFLLIFPSCSLLEQNEPTPSYIFVNEFRLKTFVNQGSSSERITDIWVFNDTEFLGMFPLPAKIPLLLYGEQNLTFQAGIKENGIGATPENYPFFNPIKVKVNLTALKTDTLKLETSYLSSSKFHFVENFENNTSFFSFLVSGLPENRVLPYSDKNVFEGKFSGKIQITKSSPVVTVGSNAKYKNTFNPGQPVYLEMDYKGEAPCIIGVQFYDTENIEEAGIIVPIAGFKESADWKKIYFNLGSTLALRKSLYYRVIFNAVLPEGKENASVHFDNIKLISF
jgi:hypothetical protein